jgi:hypothetical protein
MVMEVQVSKDETQCSHVMHLKVVKQRIAIPYFSDYFIIARENE